MDQQPQVKPSSNNVILLVIVVVVILAVGVLWYISSTKVPANTNQKLNTNTAALYRTGPISDDVLGVTISTPDSWSYGTAADGTIFFSTNPSYLDFYVRGLTATGLPTEGFKAKLWIQEDIVPTAASTNEALKLPLDRGVLPMISEEFLTVDSLPTYRVLRRLERGETLPSGEPIGITRTDVEYTYLHGQSLYRFFLEIDSDSPQTTIDAFDTAARSLAVLPRD